MKRLVLALLVGCTEPAPDFSVEAPEGTLELLPGETIELAWTITGEADTLEITARPLIAGAAVVIYDQPAAEGSHTHDWGGDGVDGTALPVEVYELRFSLHAGDAEVPDQVRTVARHGVRWLDPAPDETRVIRGVDLPVELRLRTVSHRILDLVLTAGDHEWLQRSIPGEFVAFDRSLPWNGLDRDGVPLPAGIYTIGVDVSDPDTELAYRVEGGVVDWAP